MQTFEQGDVIRVPFPYTDRNTRQRRPALVVSAGLIGEQASLLWVVMITAAENRHWTGDVAIADHAAAGLPAPSIIRSVKIATIESSHADPIGRVPANTLKAVMARVRAAITPL